VLDTTAYAHFRHGHEVVLDWMAAAESILLPMVVLGELESGVELGTRSRENRLMLNEFLKEPFVTVLPVTRAVAQRYGKVFAQLRHAGTPIPINDVWIAAATIDRGAHLLTFDGHFGAVDSLDATILPS
jgi:predicted nucleic acid-binding protein